MVLSWAGPWPQLTSCVVRRELLNLGYRMTTMKRADVRRLWR